MLRSWLKKLEHRARGDVGSFMLEDGTLYHFNHSRGALFLHATACLQAQHAGEPFPEPPETIKAIARARSLSRALEQVAGGGFSLFPYDKGALVERGELVSRSMVAGRELGEVLEDLSE